MNIEPYSSGYIQKNTPSKIKYPAVSPTSHKTYWKWPHYRILMLVKITMQGWPRWKCAQRYHLPRIRRARSGWRYKATSQWLRNQVSFLVFIGRNMNKAQKNNMVVTKRNLITSSRCAAYSYAPENIMTSERWIRRGLWEKLHAPRITINFRSSPHTEEGCKQGCEKKEAIYRRTTAPIFSSLPPPSVPPPYNHIPKWLSSIPINMLFQDFWGECGSV